MDGAFEPTAFNSDAFDVSDIVWNKLNTNQTPGWQALSLNQTPGWQVTNISQTAGWYTITT